jgi:hypothetical protein
MSAEKILKEKQQSGTRTYTKLVMIMELKVLNFTTSKTITVKRKLFLHHNNRLL